jgi:hypothetical protein
MAKAGQQWGRIMNVEPTTGDAATPADQASDDEKTADNWMFARLQPTILDSLSEQQKQALHEAVTGSASGPPVNIRLTIPLWSRRFYITVLSGLEQRGGDRRRLERTRYPLRTVANFFFAIGFVVAFYALALVALALFASVLEI